jgi:hypothetical protein
MLLLFNYAYEVISCQGKLNVVTDTKVWASFRVRLPQKPRIFIFRIGDTDHDDSHNNDERGHQRLYSKRVVRHVGYVETRNHATVYDQCHRRSFAWRMRSHIYDVHFAGYLPFRGLHYRLYSLSCQ